MTSIGGVVVDPPHRESCGCVECWHARAAEADKHETWISAIEGSDWDEH